MDIEKMMACNARELRAMQKGYELRALDVRETLSIFGFNLRYILNDKKPKFNKVFDRDSLTRRINRIFSPKKRRKNATLPSSVKTSLNYFSRINNKQPRLKKNT